jgi:hypothetical protein
VADGAPPDPLGFFLAGRLDRGLPPLLAFREASEAAPGALLFFGVPE